MMKTTYTGLCSSCVAAGACTFPRRPRQQVLNCLEFQDQSLIESEAAPRLTRQGIAMAEDDEPHEAGLCPHCELQRQCTYPRAEGGVWFCEEYR